MCPQLKPQNWYLSQPCLMTKLGGRGTPNQIPNYEVSNQQVREGPPRARYTTSGHVLGCQSTLEIGCLLSLLPPIHPSLSSLARSAICRPKTQGEAGFPFYHQHCLCINPNEFNNYCPHAAPDAHHPCKLEAILYHQRHVYDALDARAQNQDD